MVQREIGHSLIRGCFRSIYFSLGCRRRGYVVNSQPETHTSFALACGAAKSVHVTVVDAHQEEKNCGHCGIDGN